MVGEQQIVAAHARLARQARRDHHHVGIRRGRVIVRARDADVVAFDGAHLEHVERLALRHAFDDVHQNHVAQFFIREVDGAARADVAAAHYSYFIAH